MPKLGWPGGVSLLPRASAKISSDSSATLVATTFPASHTDPASVQYLHTIVVDVTHYIHFKKLLAFSALSALLCLFAPHTLQFRLPSVYSDPGRNPRLTFQSSDIGTLPVHSVTARRFVLSVADGSHFRYLQHILDQDSLQHVSVYCGDWANVAQLCDLVQVVGTTSIESIDVNIHPYPYLGQIDWRAAPVEDLEMLGGIRAPCMKLRSLRLTLPYLKGVGDAPHVQSLALWDLEELERPWFPERFPLTETVVVQLSGIRGEASILGGNRGDFSSLEFAVLKTLPGLQAAGLLKVVPWNGDEEMNMSF
ncbi:hypothetical protein C8Q74DRAFT_1451472 [Fomes fomentarius]|nr:hypothetical protein C8Q74DRAFT_1451472 [Fomes fomentarius]